MIRHVDQQIFALEEELQRQTKKVACREYTLLQTVPGIGETLGLIVLYEIGVIHRFPSVKDLIWSIRPSVRSAQNWNRPPEEVSGLMDLLRDYLESERREILDNGIKLHAIGELDRLPARVRDPLEDLRRASAQGPGMVLTLALSYGGREEIVAMARKVAEDARKGTLVPDDVDAGAVEDRLWTHGLPPLELVVRTSGEVRVSNFLLWQLAYAEIHLTETLWPDFGEEDLLISLEDFQNRERRFGKTSAQVRAIR